MPFKLFRLPILAIKLVLETMTFVDMFLLTRTSAKTKQIFKNLITIRNYQTHLVLVKSSFVFHFDTQTNPALGSAFFLEPIPKEPRYTYFGKVGNQNVPYALFVCRSKRLLKIYSETSMYTGTQLFNALNEVFKLPLHAVTIRLQDVDVPTFRCWIMWYNELFSDSLVLHIWGTCSFSNYVWILENVQTKHRLNFGVEPTQYPNDLGIIQIPDFGAATLEIAHGRWINIELLKTIRAKEITIEKTSLTDSQINTFLKDWRASKVASIWKQLSIQFRRLADPEIVSEGLDATAENPMKPDDPPYQFSFYSNYGEKCTMTYVRYDNDLDFGLDFHIEN